MKDPVEARLAELNRRSRRAWIAAVVLPLLFATPVGALVQRIGVVPVGAVTALTIGLACCVAQAYERRRRLEGARVLQQAGRTEEALAIYKDLFRGDPSYSWVDSANYFLARLYDEQGQRELALAQYRDYLKRFKRGRWRLEAEDRLAALERGASAAGPAEGLVAGSAAAAGPAADFADLRARKRKVALFGLGIPLVVFGFFLFPGALALTPFRFYPPVMAVLGVLAFFGLLGGVMLVLWHNQRCDLEAAARLAKAGHYDEAQAIYQRVKSRMIGRGNFAEAVMGLARLFDARGERMAALLCFRDYVERCADGPYRIEAASRLRELEREVDAPPQAPVPVASAAIGLRCAGERVGEYILEAPLGRGGFGEVWKARHNSLPGVVVAMKFPTAPEALEGLRRLGQIQHQLDHPHIVKTLGMDPDGHPPYVTMKYVEGQSLRQLLQREGRLPLGRALRLFDQLLAAVAYAHQRGVVHRDLKPENVLIDAQGDALVTDFELGQVTADFTRQLILSGSLATQDGRSISGTFLYMAPEQRQGDEVDVRSDLYPLGIMLFEMLTGELPQPGDKLADFLGDVPAGMEAVLSRCYTRRERRFSTVDELRAAFGSACALSPAGSA